MGIYNIIGTADEKYIKNILNKLILFNTEIDYFDYILISGSKTHVNLDVEDIIIIQQLLIEVTRIKNLEVPWLYDQKAFMKRLDDARYWASNQKNKAIFGYKPNEETKQAYNNYCQKLQRYKTKAMIGMNADEEYNLLLKSFLNLIIYL